MIILRSFVYFILLIACVHLSSCNEKPSGVPSPVKLDLVSGYNFTPGEKDEPDGSASWWLEAEIDFQTAVAGLRNQFANEPDWTILSMDDIFIAEKTSGSEKTRLIVSKGKGETSKSKEEENLTRDSWTLWVVLKES